jgi:hypothetical protein
VYIHDITRFNAVCRREQPLENQRSTAA